MGRGREAQEGGAQDVMFLSRGDRDIGVAFQSHPVGHTSSRVEGSKGLHYPLESGRVTLGAQ